MFKNRFIAMMISVMLVASLAACSGQTAVDAGKESAADPSPTPQANDTQDQESTDGETQKESGNEQQSESGKETSKDVMTGTATFNGQIDNNSIEIEMDGVEPVAFRLSEPVKEMIGELELNPGDKIEIAYQYNEHKQGVIVDLKKASDEKKK